jgi:hypothetical protein
MAAVSIGQSKSALAPDPPTSLASFRHHPTAARRSLKGSVWASSTQESTSRCPAGTGILATLAAAIPLTTQLATRRFPPRVCGCIAGDNTLDGQMNAPPMGDSYAHVRLTLQLGPLTVRIISCKNH